MTRRTNKHAAPKTLNQIAEKYGLRDRAISTWHAMASDLLNAVQPAIEEQAKTEAQLQPEVEKRIRAEADQAAKARIRDVLALPEAKGREDLAKNLALDTDSSVEQIKTILASTPKQTNDPLATLMQGRSPGISSDDGAPDEFAEVDEEEQAAQFILNAGANQP